MEGGVGDQAIELIVGEGAGGSLADVALLTKVEQAKKMNPSIELAWDGGVNEDNVEEIANGGIGVINAGGYIHGAKDPEAAYAQLAQMV